MVFLLFLVLVAIMSFFYYYGFFELHVEYNNTRFQVVKYCDKWLLEIKKY